MPLTTRQLEPEWMDQPGLDEQLHRTALRGLARINRISQSAPILWRPIAQLAQQHPLSPERPLRVLDIACGGGDVTIGLCRRAVDAGIPLSIVGCDMSKTAVDEARRAASGLPANIRFESRDVLRDPPQDTYDIVVSSLFLHHLNLKQARRLLQTMSDITKQLLLVNDLRRSPAGYAVAWLACRVLTRSPVVRVDGPQSVAGAFTIPEVVRLCQQVPLPGVRISNQWPWRFLIEWRRPDAL